MQNRMNVKRYFALIFSVFFIVTTGYAQTELSKLFQSTLKFNKLNEIEDSLSYVDTTSSIDYSTLFNEFKLQQKLNILADEEEISRLNNHNNNSENNKKFDGLNSNVSVETLTFTNASVTGNTGPTQSQINSAYANTALEGKVTINTQGIQEWTVPYTMTYTIEAWGAEGGGTDPGKGARMKADFNLTKDEVIKIVVGQMGIQEGGYTRNNRRAGGGGGGTYVIKTPFNNTASILLIAGGGGGSGTDNAGNDGLTTTTDSHTGSAGQGGARYEGSSGAGFLGNGALTMHNNGSIAYSFVNNSVGGVGASSGGIGYGGFGGGGGDGYADGGGGGGYSGGDARDDGDGAYGAGSYNSGSNTSNTAGARENHGLVVITYESAPVISSTSIVSSNATIAVTFSKAVYNTNGGSGALEAADFSFSISGGAASLSSATPSSISASGNVYTLGVGLSGTPNGSETLTVNPVDNGIYDAAGNEASTSQSNNTISLIEKILPTITGASLASDNSTIAVTISEAVYNTNGGSGALEAADFSFSISGGAASLSSATPSSISASGNVYTLGVGLSGTPNGSETITVNPVDNGIYDAAGNEASTSQSNNTASLNDKLAPTVTNLTIGSNNSSIYITFSEAVYSTNGASGSLESSDFAFTINGGVATLASNQPTEISSSGNVYTLGLSLSGTPNGSETLTVNVVDNGIYDSVGNEASTSQSNNTVSLNDRLAPIISGIIISSDNATISVTFSETVYKTNGGSGALEVSDFNLSINEGTASLSSSSPNNLSSNGNVYTLGLSLSGTPNGSEVLTVTPIDNGIYDAVGNEASTSQSNNTINLKDKAPPTISSATLSGGNNFIDITTNEGLYSDNAVSGALDINDFDLTFTKNSGSATAVSISSVRKNDNSQENSAVTLSGGESIIRFFLNITGTPNGSETIKIEPINSSSIYDSQGNAMSSEQSSGIKSLNDKVSPTVVSIYLAPDNSTLAVTMSEAIYNTNSGSGALESSDFIFSIAGGNASLSNTTPSSIAINGNVYTLGIDLSGTVNGGETLTINPIDNGIYDLAGNESSTSQSNNSVTLYDKVLPAITAVSIASDNSSVVVTFSEAVYNATGGSGSLEKADFILSISGGDASIVSATPSSISISSNSYTLGFSLIGDTNGSELLLVSPKDDSIYDGDNNEANTSQSNNSIYLNDITAPRVSSVSSITPNGAYGIGNTLQVTTIFNETVFVTGTPQLSLETGSTDALINYSSGTGTNTLIFNYTVAIGDTTSDLDYLASTSLVLNGGTIKDAANNIAILTLASPAETNSLSDNKAFIVDGNAPAVIAVNSNKANGTYGLNETIPISVSFNQDITVSGIPEISLETGIIDGVASYVSGSGTKNILFNYIVGSEQNSENLDYTSNSALKLNNGALKDASGNNTTLVLADPTKTNSLGANKDLIIDTNGPVVVSVSSSMKDGAYSAGDTINIAITFNEATIVTEQPALFLETGETDGFANFINISESRILNFNYIVTSNHNTLKLNYKSSSALVLYNGTIKDAQGNNASLSLPEPGSENSLSANTNILIDNIAPVVTYVYESNKEHLDYINMVGDLDIHWGIQSDFLSDVIKYEFSIGSSVGGIDIINWSDVASYNSYTDSSVIINNIELIDGVTYYASVRATDKAGNVSLVMRGDGVTIDLTVPSTGIVNDGLSADIAYTASINTLSSNWTGFKDAVSGIANYQYAIGTTLNGTDVKEWTINGLDTSFTYSGYDLNNSEEYFIMVKAIDKVGNISDTISSDGIIADFELPLIGFVIDGLDSDREFTNKDTLYASWSGFSDSLSGIVRYEYGLGSSPGLTDILEWTDNGIDTLITINPLLESGNTYYFSVRAFDYVNNISSISSSNGITVDFSLPFINNISMNEGSIIPVIGDTSISFFVSEPITYAKIQILTKLGDTIDDSLSLFNESSFDYSTLIKIFINSSLTSRDQLVIKIDSLVDIAGNVTNNIEYIYDVSLLGDYDLDGDITVTDLNTFINGWKSGDLSLELGPTVGDVPNLKARTNGIYDVYDAMAFTRMWHWNANRLSKQQIKIIADQGIALNAMIESGYIVFNPPKETKAVELILDYPAMDIQFEVAQEKGISDEGLSLFNADTLNGRLVYHVAYFEENNKPITINIKHLQKNNIGVNLTYQFIGENNTILSSGSEVMDITPVPSEFALHDNYPNPFNPITTINYDLPKDSYVNLVIYDIMGREVANLARKEMSAGYQTMTWNARNNTGELVSAGIYFYQIQTRDFVKTKKMVLLK